MPTADNPLRFVHISDTHINPDTDYIKNYAQYTPIIGVKALVKAVNALPFMPDFILHTGDVAYDPVPEVYSTVKAVLSEFKAPVYYLAGNHDDSPTLQAVMMGYGKEAINDYLFYDFEAKGVHIVCLDSNGPHDPEKPTGFVTQTQLDWLDTICASDDDRPLVIAIHHNAVPVGVPWLDDWMRIENGEDFHAIVWQARDRLRGVFYGHIHQTISNLRDGVLYVAAASSWCQLYAYPDPENTHLAPDVAAPPGYNVVSITDDNTYIRRHAFTLKRS
jgi:Icc protein